jgi:ABC-type uncharacterized transport system YnjBCD substrate-binding protein
MSSSISASAVAAPVAKTTPVSYLFQLPVEGSPVCLGQVKKKSDERLKQMQAAAGDEICAFSKKDFVVHPLFCESNPRWRLAARLLAIATKVYVNADGANECTPNGGTIITNPMQRSHGCPHLFGNVLLIVTASAMKKAGISHLPLVLVEDFEPEDEAEDEAKKKECAEKGYDYCEGSGQVFLRPCV